MSLFAFYACGLAQRSEILWLEKWNIWDGASAAEVIEWTNGDQYVARARLQTVMIIYFVLSLLWHWTINLEHGLESQDQNDRKAMKSVHEYIALVKNVLGKTLDITEKLEKDNKLLLCCDIEQVYSLWCF